MPLVALYGAALLPNTGTRCPSLPLRRPETVQSWRSGALRYLVSLVAAARLQRDSNAGEQRKSGAPRYPVPFAAPTDPDSSPEISVPSRASASRRPCGSGTESQLSTESRRKDTIRPISWGRWVSVSGALRCPVPFAAGLGSFRVRVPLVARCPPLPETFQSGCPSLPGALYCPDTYPSTMSGAPRCPVPPTTQDTHR